MEAQSGQFGRLQDADPDLSPLLRAPDCEGCELYWIGVASFPIPSAQRSWLAIFLDRTTKALASELELRGEYFLQFKTVSQIEKRFRQLAAQLFPQAGLARKPDGGPLPARPSLAQLKAAANGAPFDPMGHIADYCYWLHSSDLPMLLGEFFGLGGSAMYYLKPDPATKPPEIPYLKELAEVCPQVSFDRLSELLKLTLLQKDGFQASSKKLFGAGLETEPEFPGIPYIVPLLETSDFFSQPAPEREKWFKLFDIFWRESPADNGVFLASKPPLEDLLFHTLAAMREEELLYPGA